MSVAGPATLRVIDRIALDAPPDPAGAIRRVAGGVTCADGSLRVLLRAVLFAIDVDARSIRWSRDLREYMEPDVDDAADNEGNPDADVVPRSPVCSLPTVLGEDRVLVTAGGAAHVYDAVGRLRRRVEVPMADDSGPSPNTTLDGRPIFTTMDGDIHVLGSELTTIPGRYGYDVVPVAVFDDGTFGVAGYAGTGYCRTGEAGIVWTGDLGDADQLPTVNRAQHSAVGSSNEKCSAIFDPVGKRIATYPRVAVFAEYIDGGWIARSTGMLARLSAAGDVIWERPLAEASLRWGCCQPIVDANGLVFTFDGRDLVAFDGAGDRRATLALGAVPFPLFPIRAGLMGTIVDDALMLIG